MHPENTDVTPEKLAMEMYEGGKKWTVTIL